MTRLDGGLPSKLPQRTSQIHFHVLFILWNFLLSSKKAGLSGVRIRVVAHSGSFLELNTRFDRKQPDSTMESTLQLCQFLLFLSKAHNMLRGTVRLVGVIGLASWVRSGSTGSLPPRETDPRGQSLPLVPVPPSAHNSDPTGREATGAKATRGAPPPAPSTCGAGCRRWVFPDAVDTHGARCLDGSPPGFYHRPGRGSDASNFLVYSHGGSWCYDLNSSDTSATWNCLVSPSSCPHLLSPLPCASFACRASGATPALPQRHQLAGAFGNVRRVV